LDDTSLSRDRTPTDANENTAALVKLVTEVGPDIGEISRRLGQFKESVRYRYKEKLVKRGFQIKADVDYGALGLTRIVMKVTLSPAYEGHAHELFETMSDLCYVVAYAGTTPHGTFIVHGGVPKEFVEEYHRFMQSLVRKGVFSEIEFFDCEWFRVAPMRADCFDFDEGVWDVDWTDLPPVDDKAARATSGERQKFDKVDLLIVKELWKDSSRSLRDIQEAIKKLNGIDINYKTLGWHFKHHVQRNRLVRDYSVAWHGIRYNFTLQKLERMGKHEYMGFSIIVRRTNEQEKMTLRSQLNRLPFLWSEASGEAYYSQLFLPLPRLNEALEYMKKILKPYGKRAELFLLDLSEMRSFTIGYMLWNDERSEWTFDGEATMPRLERSMLKILGRTA